MSLKVLAPPSSRRKGALPVLASGKNKFPVLAALYAPALALAHVFAGEC